MPVLHIDASAVTQYTQVLRTMSRSALPNAVRTALNKTALDVKQRTMPAESDVFTHRRPTFFKANSKVEFAKGYDVNTMRATVGFVENSGTQQQAVQDMEQQENGGSIGGRTFIAEDAARIGKRRNTMVRSMYRIGKGRKIREEMVDARAVAGKSEAQQFLFAAYEAGKGGYVLGNKVVKGKRFLMRINSVHRMTAGEKKPGDTVVNSTALYSVQTGRHVHPRATHFMSKASLESGTRMQGFYVAEAEKQLMKLKK